MFCFGFLPNQVLVVGLLSGAKKGGDEGRDDSRDPSERGTDVPALVEFGSLFHHDCLVCRDGNARRHSLEQDGE